MLTPLCTPGRGCHHRRRVAGGTRRGARERPARRGRRRPRRCRRRRCRCTAASWSSSPGRAAMAAASAVARRAAAGAAGPRSAARTRTRRSARRRACTRSGRGAQPAAHSPFAIGVHFRVRLGILCSLPCPFFGFVCLHVSCPETAQLSGKKCIEGRGAAAGSMRTRKTAQMATTPRRQVRGPGSTSRASASGDPACCVTCALGGRFWHAFQAVDSAGTSSVVTWR